MLLTLSTFGQKLFRNRNDKKLAWNLLLKMIPFAPISKSLFEIKQRNSMFSVIAIWHLVTIAVIFLVSRRTSRGLVLLTIHQLTPTAFSHLIRISAAASGTERFQHILFKCFCVSPNIHQLWSMAELQFSGSRRDLAEEWLQPLHGHVWMC